MMNKKIKSIKIRLSPEELDSLKKYAKEFGSMSECIRNALKYNADKTPVKLFDMRCKLCDYYNKYNVLLSHISGNLNQATKRANELNVIGMLSDDYLNNVFLPVIKDTHQTLHELLLKLSSLTDDAMDG